MTLKHRLHALEKITGVHAERPCPVVNVPAAAFDFTDPDDRLDPEALARACTGRSGALLIVPEPMTLAEWSTMVESRGHDLDTW